MTFEIPIKTVSESNMREHWAARSRRKKSQTETTRAITLSECRKLCWPLTVVITLTRLASRRLDDGNLGASMKGIQDGIAKALRIDDGSPIVRWDYRQEPAPRGHESVRVSITSEYGHFTSGR